MLANGITLGYSKEGDSYTLLDTLKSVPDLGLEPEMVENTKLNAKNKQYELGVGDSGELEYTFKYEDNKTGTEIRAIYEMCDEGKDVKWEQSYPDGTKFQFEGIPSYKLVGGGLNDPVELQVKIAVSSDFVRVDPV